MILTDKINIATQYIKSLTKQEFQQYLLGTIAGIAILAFGASYYVYSVSASLVQEIKKLNTQTNKIKLLIAQSKKLAKEEESIQEILAKKPDFTMNSFFEQFYTKHAIKPESNWKPEEGAVIEGSRPGVKYQEIILRATFKNQTMKKLVEVLQDVYAKPIIYLKGLEITAEGQKINFELMLATKQAKKELGELE